MLTKKMLKELDAFVTIHKQETMPLCSEAPILKEYFECKYIDVLEDVIEKSTALDDFVKKHQKPAFQTILFRWIDEKGFNDSDIYKKAGIDRRHFSKIRSNPSYHPSKNTVIALAFALSLDEEQTDSLLVSAGYSLSKSDTYDLVILFCLKKKIYSIHDVNLALDYFSLKPLVGTI